MKVIVGLGNPGKKYDNTRHNIGFEALDYIADKEGISINTGKHKALIGTGYMGGEKVLLVKPQTFMNLSGESLRPIMDFYKLEPEDLSLFMMISTLMLEDCVSEEREVQGDIMD